MLTRSTVSSLSHRSTHLVVDTAGGGAVGLEGAVLLSSTRLFPPRQNEEHRRLLFLPRFSTALSASHSSPPTNEGRVIFSAIPADGWLCPERP